MRSSPDLDRELDQMADDVLRDEERAQSVTADVRPGPGVRVAHALPPSRAMVPSSPAGGFSGSAATEDFPHHERNLAMAVHIGTMCTTLFSGGLFLPLLVPVLAKVAFKDASPALQEHVRQQLNLQLTLAIVAVVGVAATVMTLGIGVFALVPLLLFFLGVEVVASIKGALAASNGEHYEFPFTMNLVKPDPAQKRLR